MLIVLDDTLRFSLLELSTGLAEFVKFKRDMKYPSEDDHQSFTVNIGSSSVLFDHSLELFKGGFGGDLEPLVLPNY